MSTRVPKNVLLDLDGTLVDPRDGFIASIHGSELGGSRANNAELIHYILERESLVPGGAVMIGDRAQDIHAARKNEMCSIGAAWGYGAPGELVRAGVTALCERPPGLPDAVMDIKCLPVT